MPMSERTALPDQTPPFGRRFPRLARGWEVFRALTVADLRTTKDFTITGVLKWMLEPISYMFVYFVLVATFLKRPTAEQAFPLFLLCALVPWRFFTGAFVGSMYLLPRFSFVISNTATPTLALPLVAVATEAVNMLIALLLFVPMVAYYGIDVWPAVLWLPVLLGILIVLAIGPAYLGTVFGLYFPDYRGVVQNLVRAGFFISSALITLDFLRRQAPEAHELRLLIRANPFTGVFDSFRSVFLTGTRPLPLDLAIPAGAGLLLLVIGLVVYRRRQREFPKEV